MLPAPPTRSTVAPVVNHLTAPATSPGASSYYFSLLGHTGPSAIPGYAGVFAMQSWSGGAAGQPATAASSAQARSVNIQREFDHGSPFLAQACSSGKFFVQVTVLSVSQGNTITRAKLANVVIANYAALNTASGSRAESITLNYASGSFF